jgi:hypothetical protein
MRKLFPALPLLAGLLGTGCSRPIDPNAPSPLTLEKRSFQKSLPGCGDREKREEPCVSFRVEYPEVTAAPNDDVRIQINAGILAALHLKHGESFESEAGDLILAFEDFRRESGDSEITYYVRRTVEVLRHTAWVLSLEINDDTFTGGAHPAFERSFLNLRPQSGATIRLEELLDDDALPRLTALAERHFRRIRELPPERKLSEAGFHFDGDQFTLNRNWGVTGRGLVFYFNANEIAASLEGPTEILLPWSEVRPLLRRDAGIAPAGK